MPEAEWNDERTKIICELFAEQVRAGNRPNTHLNNIGYREVAIKFQERTQLLYTKLQLKNKWDKLKSDYITWKKLLKTTAGLPWDSARGTIAADDEWWKIKNKELPGARRFRNAGLQNEDKLKIMFNYITSDGVDPSPPAVDGLPSPPESPTNGVDHTPLTAGGLPSASNNHTNGVLPSAPESRVNGLDHSQMSADGFPSAPDGPMNGVNLFGSDNNAEDNDGTQPEHEPPFNRVRKRRINVRATKDKKSRAETALLMQTHLQRIEELAKKAQHTFEKFSSGDDSERPSIQDVMTLVRECGARCGSNEHFIATELFVNSEQREMFLTMETHEERFQWLRRKYIVKYLSGTGSR
ncbi:hypothetical protein ACP4OV_003812 [Aristida adscensionis]